MYRFLRQPRWIALAIIVPIACFACVLLAQWQWQRHEGRKSSNSVFETNTAVAAVAAKDLMSPDATVTADRQWRMVTATGTYDASAQRLVRRRPLDNTNGFWVATPLVTTDGRVLVVNRGWLPAGSDSRSTPPVPAPPVGSVTIAGRVQPSQPAPTPQPADLPTGQITNLDVTLVGGSLSHPIYPAYVNLSESTPPQPPGLKLIPMPAESDGPHLSYAMQWIAFAIIFVIGMGLLIRREALTRKQDAAAKSEQAQTHEELLDPSGPPAQVAERADPSLDSDHPAPAR